MCGIHGLFNLDGRPAEVRDLEAMGDVTIHRGPDDHGYHVDGPCGIAMRRLSIIDLAGGHQPISSADNAIWVVCNGEIYNFRELRRDLESRGAVFKTNSDTETLIHLYEAYGDDLVNRLNGMYAFALWDARRRRLLIGRDRLGIKPVYLRITDRQLAFASEAKSLLALPGVEAKLDTAALHSYLGLGYVAAPLSMFQGIEKLAPAEMLVVEGGKVSRRCYWKIPQEIDRGLTESQWVERVRARLAESVRMQMVSDVPLGAFLSGGIDSSAVVGLMAAHSDRPVRTYAIGFTGSGADEYYNELPYARQISERFGTEHREIVVRPDVAALLPRLLWHMDEPIADTAFITTYLVSQFARQDVTVILSGVGGDELFGGYRRYLGNHYAAQFNRLPAWLRRAAMSVGRHLPSDRHSPLMNYTRLARGFLESAELSFEQRYQGYVQVFGNAELGALCRVNGAPCPDLIAKAFDDAHSEDALNRMLCVDAQTQLPDDLLALTDKMSMATSLECRVPLLDHELVELAARIPESIKVRGGELKHLLKAAVRGLLPEEILNRKKRGFGTPMGDWLRRGLAPLVEGLLGRSAVQKRGWLNPEPIQQVVAAHASNTIDGTDRLLSLLALEVWARLYIDRRTHEDVAAELKEMLA